MEWNPRPPEEGICCGALELLMPSLGLMHMACLHMLMISDFKHGIRVVPIGSCALLGFLHPLCTA